MHELFSVQISVDFCFSNLWSALDQSCGITEEDIRNSFKVEPFYAKSESDVLQLKEDPHIVFILSSHCSLSLYMIFILMMKSFSLSGGEALLDRDDQSPF